MREEVSQQDDPSEAMKSPRVENAEAALNGISAPSHGEKKSWANDLTKGAQLVSVRVLRNTCQKYVTLNSKDQALWPCVARRITKYLETGEVLGDEDVTQMTKEELHRTLDKPRKIRVEFNAHRTARHCRRTEELSRDTPKPRC